MVIPNPFSSSRVSEETLLAQLREAAAARRESERRWYAGLPTKVILSLCFVVAVLTGLLSLAPQAPQRPPAPPSAPPPAPPVPAGPTPLKPTSVELRIKGKELFAYNSSALRVRGSEAKRELDTCLRQDLKSVRIVGHADCIGSDEQNLALSHRRALAVKHYLVTKGVETQLITAEGHGSAAAKADPLCAGRVRATPTIVAQLEKFRRVDVACEYSRVVLQV